MPPDHDDCDHVRHSGHGWTHCQRCGARCARDSQTGRIVAYDRRPGKVVAN